MSPNMAKRPTGSSDSSQSSSNRLNPVGYSGWVLFISGDVEKLNLVRRVLQDSS